MLFILDSLFEVVNCVNGEYSIKFVNGCVMFLFLSFCYWFPYQDNVISKILVTDKKLVIGAPKIRFDMERTRIFLKRY